MDDQRFGDTPLRVILAGATGWAGSALARGIARSRRHALVAAVGAPRRRPPARRGAGRAAPHGPVYATAAEALAPCDVFVDYTQAGPSPRATSWRRSRRGAHVVVGASGLSDADYAEIDAVAERASAACWPGQLRADGGAAAEASPSWRRAYIPQWEIIDYAHDAKPDAPSGTAASSRCASGRCARRPSACRSTRRTGRARRARRPRQRRAGPLASACPATFSAEVVFGMPDQRLHPRHDAGTSAEPYVDGALLAIRKVATLVGVHAGSTA